MFLSSTLFNVVYPFCRSQIAGFLAKEASTKVSVTYSNFADIFSLNLASKLPKYNGINNYTIELVDSQQLLYGPIYNLEPVELETLKAYIKIYLDNRFIKPFKLPVDTPILFDQTSKRSFQSCLTIKASTISWLRTGTYCH